ENAGNLDVVLEQLADYQERKLELKDRLVNALIYPGVIFLTSLAVSVFLMTFVVPMLLDSLVDLGKELPWPTKVLQQLSGIMIAWWGWILAAVALGTSGFLAGIRTARGKY